MERTREERSLSTQQIPPWASELTRWMDDGIRIPGTNIGIGLDAIIGFLVPSFGDALTAVTALSLLVLGFQMRVPKVVLMRMIMNIGIDALVGAVPILGDIFDVAFRANRKNLELIERYANEPSRKADIGDYLLVGVGLLCVAALVIVPLVVAIFAVKALAHLLS